MWNILSPRIPGIVKGDKSLNLVWSKWGSQWWGFGKVFNVLQSPIGRMASRPMRNIETFPSKQMYLYLSLVERKVAEFYHTIYRRRYSVWLKWLIFIAFSGQLIVSLLEASLPIALLPAHGFASRAFWRIRWWSIKSSFLDFFFAIVRSLARIELA